MENSVPHFNSLSIEQITESFAKQVVLSAKINLSGVIRANLDMWEAKLFPVIAAYDISKYQVLADILVEAGCRSADMTAKEKENFIEVVGGAVRRIKVERGELSASQKRTATRSSIPPSPAQRQVVNALPAKPSKAQPSPVPMASVKAIVPAVVPSKKFDLTTFPFRETNERVRAEVMACSREGVPLIWDERDDDLLALYSQISKDRYVPLMELNKCFTVSDTLKSACWFAFKSKCQDMGVNLKEHGYVSR